MEDTSNGPEMQVLQAFFSHVGGFACDRAKDYIEREKESSSRGGGGGVAWASLLSALAHLAATERAYHSMTFLGQKPGGQSFFSRKDTLRSMYGSLCSELRRVTGSGAQAAAGSGSGGGNAAVHSEDILGHLAEQLGHLVQSRQEMADLYEKLHGLSLGRHATPGELLASLGAVTQKFSSRVHHPVLSALSSSFQHETEALGHLLRAQRDVSSWLFLPALLELHAAHAKLAAWASRGSERARDGAAAPPQRKPLFGGTAQRVAPTPHLHQWMVKYKTFLLAKFSFYFHEALSRQAGGEMKSLTAKTSPDFFGKVSSFIKKTDAANVSLIFDTRGLEDSFKTCYVVTLPARLHVLRRVTATTTPGRTRRGSRFRPRASCRCCRCPASARPCTGRRCPWCWPSAPPSWRARSAWCTPTTRRRRAPTTWRVPSRASPSPSSTRAAGARRTPAYTRSCLRPPPRSSRASPSPASSRAPRRR
ncbi:KICSTOR subunit 2 isoform X2 [Lampetra fluviatilis]